MCMKQLKYCIPSQLVMDHLGKGVSAVFQPDLGCLIIRVCQHLEVQAYVCVCESA